MSYDIIVPFLIQLTATCQIVLYFSKSTLVLPSYIDVVLTLSVKTNLKSIHYEIWDNYLTLYQAYDY